MTDCIRCEFQVHQVHREKLFSTRRAIPKTGPEFLHGPSRRALHSRRTEESGWEAWGEYGAGDRRGSKRDPPRGDRGLAGDPSRSFQLLSSGGKLLLRLEEDYPEETVLGKEIVSTSAVLVLASVPPIDLLVK